MKLVVAFLLLLSFVACDKWAVLVAGSNTYSNYRHQADVFHAYQILKKNGFSQDRIITFAYDDIANNSRNPFKGKVFNKPTYKDPGVDVYEGVFIDYKGSSVNPTVFLNVLEGNKTAVKGLGSGKVLESTAQDNVFIYFADHGAPGLIAFPSKYLYAKDLISTFSKMAGKYSKLVFYLQACQSGSMFTNLVNNTKIYALSAANPSESSWGTYCAPQDVVQGKHIGSCLGDLFSVNFLENTEQSDIFSMSLNDQFGIIKQKTNKSHVMQWGDQSFTQDKVGQYLSTRNGFGFRYKIPSLSQLRRNGRQQIASVHFDSRSNKLQNLMEIYAREQTPQALAEFTEEVASTQAYSQLFDYFIARFQGILLPYDAYNIQFDCLKESIDYFQSLKGRFTDYGLGFIKYFARACQISSIEQIKQAINAAIIKQNKYLTQRNISTN